ncbi:nucleotide exchange factor GrpE [Coleofasciculus sp. E1-EBD-02]|uniref:nucleotide exchange factor GrpE n=1 Tax=Coleofasciculus sp. E1-EBD-02 TaxID=3068481 RepID=UPI003301C39B
MAHDLNLLGLGLLLWFVLTTFLISRFSPKKRPENHSASIAVADPSQIEELEAQCQRLRYELEARSQQLSTDIQDTTFEQLRPLLTNYPTACRMIEARPDLPAKNLVALFTPLENLIQNWGYEPIGQPWEQVPYNSQLHQPDVDDITEGELVYIRFVGYRDHDRILCPAKVSRTLPRGVSH